MKTYFPLGTVVMLKEATKSLMIIGIMQQDDEGNQYDYVAVMFPEGYVNEETFFLFNEEDIEKVVFVGCINADSQTYMQVLKLHELENDTVPKEG